MKTFTNKTIMIKRKWYIIDVKNQILGRIATKIATILIGKHKPEYTPNIDSGDYVIILNANKVTVTGKKYNNKIYYHHTGYIGGLKKNTYKDLIKNNKFVIKIAIKGMLPRGPLGYSILKKLKVYNDDKHNHTAQQPEVLIFKN